MPKGEEGGEGCEGGVESGTKRKGRELSCFPFQPPSLLNLTTL